MNDKRNLSVTLLASWALLLSGCSFGEEYAAEVGYYSGGEIAWEIWGDFGSLDECRTAAIDRYNFYFSENRAYSWACLLKDGDGGYESRHR